MVKKIDIIDIEGKKVKEIKLPEFFSGEVREDMILKCFYIKQTKQPYSNDINAGNKYSASGKIRHRRHRWRSHYGRGIARLPRKVMWRRGTQFYWIGATVPGTVGGRRAHPPKVIGMINTKKMNKKEYALALKSSIASTASEKYIKERYSSLGDKKISDLPIVVDSKILELKTKDFVESLGKILKHKNQELSEIALPKKSIRPGKGKLRGRKYKKTAGILFVVGNQEKTKFKNVEIKKAKELSVKELFPPGRLTIYTENSINDLNERFEGEKVEVKKKKEAKK